MYDITYKLKEFGVFNDTSFPRLISYPRTGSHWFRILMEAYLQKPSVVQSFFDPNPKEIWGFHIHHRHIDKPHHSEGPVTGLNKAIYLYRNPVDTIFSQLKYHGIIPIDWDGNGNLSLDDEIQKFSHEYFLHLKFYLNNASNIDEILYIKYEDLAGDPENAFKKCVEFLNEEWKAERFKTIYSLCDKSLTKKLTPHDVQAVDSLKINNKALSKHQKECFVKSYKEHIDLKFKEIYK